MSIKKCGIIIKDIQNDQVLLVFGRKSQKWGFPKGHMEEGESEEETALRELKEETGIVLHASFDHKNRIRFRNNIYFIINVNKNEICPQINVQDIKEIEKVSWFSSVDIMRIPEYQCNFGLKNWIKKSMEDKNEKSLIF